MSARYPLWTLEVASSVGLFVQQVENAWRTLIDHIPRSKEYLGPVSWSFERRCAAHDFVGVGPERFYGEIS
jgi:hypothetical protein